MSQHIFTVVPVFNRVHYAEACLAQLQAQVCDLPQTVIVVDDGSSDGTAEMIRSKFPDTVLIVGTGDWYWTGSVWQGVERAMQLSGSEDDYVFVLNDDLEFEENLLQKLIKCQRQNPRAIIQALGAWVDRKDEIHFAGFKINPWTGAHAEPHVGEKRSSFPADFLFEVDSLTGRGVLFPVKVFKEVGNYDRRIVHRGDLELPCRAANAGWKLLIFFGATVYTPPLDGKPNINEKEAYRLRDLFEYFTGPLSSSHLPTLWWNARTMGRGGFHSVVLFLMVLARHAGHFLKKVRSF